MSTAVPHIVRRRWWNWRIKYHWSATYRDCGLHLSEGDARTVEECLAAVDRADQLHTRHHARLAERERLDQRLYGRDTDG